MKKFIVIICAGMVLQGYGQAKPAVKSSKAPAAAAAKKAVPAKKVVPAQPVLKNALDSFSYALGLSMANFYKEQGVDDIKTPLVMRAIEDSKSGKPLLNEAAINNCIMAYMQEKRKAKSAGARKAGETFLAENAKKPGVVVLPSGLQYQVLQEGSGPKPTANDKVKCHYQGSFIDGKVFESSYETNQPISFPVSGVIKGWTEALQLMNTGSKWRLYIPSNLAYGDMDYGKIPGGSVLIFDVELLEIEKPEAPAGK
jgi:FKBP-type peptidyl-prolyl cis-trans isomerase FklB